MDIEGEIKNFIKVWLAVGASLCYCYFIASKIPKGKLRLFSILPVVYLYTILPLYLSFASTTFAFSGTITWLANSKLLLFAFDQGPLACDPQKSLALFILIACLPVTIKHYGKYPSPKPPKLPLNWPTKVLIYAILIGVHEYYRDHVHPNLMILLYSYLLYFGLDMVVGVCNVVVHAMLGVEVESPSNEPFFSTSLQEFWGKRWNLSVTILLRHSVYKPVRSSLETMLGAGWATLLGVLGSFLVSGLMHEMMVYYVTRASPTWEMTWFFVLHGFCVVVEFVVKRLLKDRWQLPLVVSCLLTSGFMFVTADWLFFLSMRNIIIKMFEEFQVSIDFVTEISKLARDVLRMYCWNINFGKSLYTTEVPN